MKKVVSLSNLHIKRVLKIRKGRLKTHCLIEGKKLVVDAVSSGALVEDVFITEENRQHVEGWLESLAERKPEVILVPFNLMKKISDVEKAPGILAVAARPDEVQSGLPRRYAAFLISIRDPGNFGAITRTAEAAGCEFLAYTADCVDPFGSKVIRASMGSIFRVPLVQVDETETFLQEMSRKGVHLYALVPHAGRNLFDMKWRFPAMVLIGSESRGLPESLPVGERILIPMQGKVESLNAATAAAICFYSIR